jgi:hypothetical protein
MNGPLDDYVFEIHVTDVDGGEWREVSHHKTIDAARREAAHLIGSTPVRSVKIVEVREYDAKPPLNR